MKRYVSVFVAALFVFTGVFGSAIAAHAEDQTETQLKQMEIQYEAQKKAAEHSSEAQKQEIEKTYEAQKREIENTRESQKQTMESERESAKSVVENDTEDTDKEGSDEGDHHRSAVAKFVHSLDALASTTDHGIGERVREVAQEQNDLKDKTADNLKALESRSALVKFLIGSNQESLKALEGSTLAIQNHIDTLTQIQASTTPAVQKILTDQITLLVNEKARIQAMIDANKDNSGIFGWFVRMF